MEDSIRILRFFDKFKVLRLDPFWKFSVECYCHPDYIFSMLPALIYNAYHLELAGILILENVSKLLHFEACLHF